MTGSKPWVWNKVDALANEYWEVPDDEFLPIAERWKSKGYKKALDLGCGTGRHSIHLAQNGFDVEAFDLSPDGIEKFRAKIRGRDVPINIRMGDMLNLPYGENTFDCVLAFHAIHHTDVIGLKRIIGNISKVLKPDGEAFITLASKEADSWQKFAGERIDNNTLIKKEGPEIGIPHTYLEYEEVVRLLKDFSIVNIRQIINYLRQKNEKHAHFFVLVKKF